MSKIVGDFINTYQPGSWKESDPLPVRREIRDALKLADVWELKSGARYLIICDGEQLGREESREIGEALNSIGAKVAVFHVPDVEAFRVFELEPGDESADRTREEW